MSWVGICLMKRLCILPSSNPWRISSSKLKNWRIYWNIVGVTDPLMLSDLGIWEAAYWLYTSMLLAPSLNCSSWAKIYAVCFLNFCYRSLKACWSFNFFEERHSGIKFSIWLNKFLAGPFECLKFILIEVFEKWLKIRMLFLWSYSAITLVNIDLLYGMKSLFVFLLLDPLRFTCFLNLLRISSNVVTLLS
jgi:hypothetical protein